MRQRGRILQNMAPRPLPAPFIPIRNTTFKKSLSLFALIMMYTALPFAVLDYLMKPHLFIPLLFARLGMTWIAYKVYQMMQRPVFENHAMRLSLLLLYVFSFTTTYICNYDLGPIDPYYAGIGLPVIALGLLMPFTVHEIAGPYLLIWLAYFIPNAMKLQPEQIAQFAGNNFFLMAAMILSVIGSRYRLTQEIAQWQSRRRLTLAHHKMKKRAASFEEEARERTNQLIQSERLAVVGQLTGGIAHDFNNLLTSILGICELQLAVLPKDHAVTSDIKLISKVGKRAANLVKKLLAFSRRQILEPQWVQPNDIILDMENMVQRLIGEQVEIKILRDKKLGTVLVDPIQLEQVILNLAVNARDAMPSGGNLIIETENVRLDRLYCHKKGLSIPPGEYVMMAFSDTGHGMKPETRSKIFEPFFTTKEKGQGTGLGLSTVYGIVKQSHGDIFVYSEEGKGSTFKIFLPRETMEADFKITDADITVAYSTKSAILLVEDDDQIRTMAARMLEDYGYQVLQASHARDALAYTRDSNQSIDLLITDIVLPDLSGFELEDQFKAVRPHTGVLMVSGYTQAMVRQHYGLKDIPNFIQKPFTVDQIQDKVREMLDPETATSAVLPPALAI